MIPTSHFLSLAVVIATFSSVGSSTKWHLADTYNASNFFDKFDFFTGRTEHMGYSVYQNKEEALRKGLIGYRDDLVFIQPDNSTVLNSSEYPYGDKWPEDGRVDIFGHSDGTWSDQGRLMVTKKAEDDECRLERANGIVAEDRCDVTQSGDKGCTTYDRVRPDNIVSNVYAMEWTSDFIKIYRWQYERAPPNVHRHDSLDTSTWGFPILHLQTCDIDRHFKNQRIVLDVHFCHDGSDLDPGEWSSWKFSGCDKTIGPNRIDFVAQHQEAFHDSYYLIEDIRYFQESESQASAAKPVAGVSLVPTTTTLLPPKARKTKSKVRRPKRPVTASDVPALATSPSLAGRSSASIGPVSVASAISGDKVTRKATAGIDPSMAKLSATPLGSSSHSRALTTTTSSEAAFLRPLALAAPPQIYSFSAETSTSAFSAAGSSSLAPSDVNLPQVYKPFFCNQLSKQTSINTLPKTYKPSLDNHFFK